MREVSRDYFKEVIEELKEAFPDMTIEEGKGLWTLFANREMTLPSGRKISASFRAWGEVIAEVCGKGTSYLTFYCAHLEDDGRKFESIVRKKLEERGWKFEDVITHCSKCGKEIGRFEPFAWHIRTGEVLCMQCLVEVNNHE